VHPDLIKGKVKLGYVHLVQKKGQVFQKSLPRSENEGLVKLILL
jgi:hypothetical protein